MSQKAETANPNPSPRSSVLVTDDIFFCDLVVVSDGRATPYMEGAAEWVRSPGRGALLPLDGVHPQSLGVATRGGVVTIAGLYGRGELEDIVSNILARHRAAGGWSSNPLKNGAFAFPLASVLKSVVGRSPSNLCLWHEGDMVVLHNG